ncbi:hypothetical protein PthBH41_37810 (plasmid) [Parageobacillus thermoglucosidasius]|nr:transposase [Parageobacillus thermoglucosidasius]BDG34069.1 hypothetical protein PthBH41_37810 [Parageobacillus thermoglucosidasius]
MAQYHITVNDELLHRLFTRDEGLAKLLEQVFNQILEAQAEEQLGARRYERTEERRGYRNGSYPRQLTTRVGRLTLRVPRTRRWGILHGTVSTVSTKRTSSSTGINGNGGEWGVYRIGLPGPLPAAPAHNQRGGRTAERRNPAAENG